jgi:hypothetical protein
VVPKIAKRGGSFKGAAAYYLHDKGAETNRRVAFCQTENLPVAEPELAWRWMAFTAKHAGILKADARVAPTGRKMQKPVYTLSLSWSPEESPSRAEMIAAAHSALQAVGLSKCQTLLVAHNDEPHPHIHAIVNLVDPDTGKVRDPGLDRRKLSRWAEDYEKAQGKVRCEQRVENNARRDKGELVKDRQSKTRQDIDQEKWIEGRILAERQRRQLEGQEKDRGALKDRAREDAQAIRAHVKAHFRPEWAAYFKQKREDARTIKHARLSFLSRMRTAIKQRDRLNPDGKDWVGNLMQQFLRSGALAEALQAAQERELDQLRKRMSELRTAAVAEVWAAHRHDSRKLEVRHTIERAMPPPLAPPDEAAHRADLRARFRARDKVREREAEKARQKSTLVADKEQARGTRRGPRAAGDYEALKSATPAPPTREDRPVRGARPGPRRAGDYEALKPATRTPATPPKDEEERRREALRAEFRQQAEEIARRRRERKHKDRDRDRER